MERVAERHGAATLREPLIIEVDRLRARFGSWYELFPRSFGGLQGVQASFPGWPSSASTSLYLPPIHPIGLTNRKGRNNALTAGPDDPGSPWAIGDADRRPRGGAPGAGHDRGRQGADAPRRASTASTSRSTSPSSARPITRG